MNYIALIGLFSGVITIIGYFMPDRFRQNKYFVIALMIIIAIGCSYITNLNNDLLKVKNVSRTANQLIKNQSFNFTDMSFIHASLSLLEEHKDLYSGSYERAVEIYDRINRKDVDSTEVHEAANQIEGIIRGIAILSNDK